MDAEIIILAGNLLPWHNSGVAVSVLRKIRLIESAWGVTPFLMITDYNPDINRICQILRHMGKNGDSVSLTEGTQVFGVYNFFQHMPEHEPDSVYDYEKERTDRIFHSNDGSRVKQIEHCRESTGRLRLVERLDDNGNIKQQVYYDDCGVMSMIRVLDTDHTERWLYEYYLTYEQNVCIKTEYQYDKNQLYKNNGNVITRMTVYNDNGDTLFTCADEMGLAAYCLDQLTHDINKKYFVMQEAGLDSASFNGLKKENLVRVCVIHNIFNVNPYDINSEPSPYFKNVCAHGADYDGIVFLTEAERGDFLDKYKNGSMDNTFVIPHPYYCEAVAADAAGRPASPPKVDERAYYDEIVRPAPPKVDERAYPCEAGAAKAAGRPASPVAWASSTKYEPAGSYLVRPAPPKVDERAYPCEAGAAKAAGRPASPPKVDERERRKAVIVSRFDAHKRIDAAIRIFRQVVDKIPDARLEIYGYAIDDIQKQYELLIRELELTKNVKIMGHTSDSADVFCRAALSIMASAAEGYPLTLVESICNGCPVFAFDIKYGPSDIINDGVTGFLFKDGDEDAFAEKMIDYFNDESLQQTMSKNAYNDVGRFSQNTFLDKWRSLMETLIKRRNI